MGPVRVLHVVSTMNFAGIETLLINLYRNIDRNKLQFDFLIHSSEKNDYEDEILSLGGKIFRVKKLNVFNKKGYENCLYEFFINHPEYQIIHSHLNTFSKHVLKAASRAGVKHKIAHSHISFPGMSFKTIIKSISKFNINKYTDYRFACSKDAAKWVFGKTNNVHLFNNAIDSKNFVYNSGDRSKVREKLNVSSDTLLIGNVGRFNPQKNHSLIIDVFAELNKKDENSKLLLIGEGELKNKIKLKVEKLGLSKKVIFLGVTKDVNKYLQAMDIFLFPSLYEGLGIVSIEAQASGLRTIVSDTVPIETKVTDLIEYYSLRDSIDSWVNAILDFNNTYERKNMYSIIKEAGYDLPENTKWIERFYLEL
ncbi:glycosyltransferase family 1 protein [Rossellomorea yichunensis]|uniref:glycosyltransferase family 1 protein n=1 Tax=Rossellomorea yichunensis TaxID=3077331 RepID=UPI0028DEDBCA|nr:glycosyltransferase family 1 protein [Rossellomorea sp. YC4-1]MDT9026818.1 glycosyltransferase family 1 protein [Rossellomorea sp. YC4-1]